MKKKGFTLIELLGVLIVLSIIALILVPTVNKFLREFKKDSYQNQIKEMCLSVENWKSDHIAELPEDGETITITLANLKNGGYIDYRIKNPITNKYFPNDMLIELTAREKSLECKVIENSGNNDEDYNIDAPILVLKGTSQIHLDVAERYVEPGYYATTSTGITIPKERIQLEYYQNGNLVSGIDSSKNGTFQIKYSVTDKEVTVSLIREVIVKDITPPTIIINGHSSDSESEFTIRHNAEEDFSMPNVVVIDNSQENITPVLEGHVLNKVPGTYVVTYTATDSTGNSTSMKVNFEIYDETPPKVEILGNPQSWTNQSITLAVNASDNGSGLPSNAYSFDGGTTWQSGNTILVEKNKVLNIWVRDNVDNTTKKTVTVSKIDKTLPDVTFTVTNGTSGLNYWYTSNVGIKITPTTGGSGVSEYRYCVTTESSCDPDTIVSGASPTNLTLMTESASNKICFHVTNTLNVSNSGCSNNYKIDKTTPDVTFAVTSGTSGTNGWYKSNVGVKITPSAGNSGVSSYKYCTTTSDSCTPSTAVSGSGTTTVTLSTASATNKICVLVTSVSGQKNTKCSGNYKIDKTTPDVTFAVTSGTSGTNGWYKSNVGVKITPSAGNSGVSSYKYCTTTSDSCTPSTAVSGSNPTTVTLSTESATNKICVSVTSASGLTNTKCSGNYKIDKSAPTLTVDGHTSDYTVTIEHSSSYTIPTGSATDNLTTPSVTRSGSVTPTIEGTYTVTYTATDEAGNSKTLKLTVKVKDTIPPTVEITGNPTSWTNQNVTIAVKASDSGTGLASSAYSYDGGSTWTTGNSTIVGSNTTLNIWVKDKAGNITKKTVVIDKIDKTLSDVTFTVTSGTTGSNYWYTSNVGVKITPSAGNSGVSSYKYCTTTGDSCTPSTAVSGSGTTTVTLSTESATNKICVLVTSVSGQKNTKCSGNYKIDKTAPILTVDGHTSNYAIAFAPTSSYTLPTGSATDNLTQNPSVTRSGSVTPTIEGTYTITWLFSKLVETTRKIWYTNLKIEGSINEFRRINKRFRYKFNNKRS